MIFKKCATPKGVRYAGATLIVLGFVLISLRLFLHSPANNGKVRVLGAASVQPDFKPIPPEDSSQKVVSTQNNGHKIVTYQDTFVSAKFIVSQQRLPDNFKTDPQAITHLSQFSSAELIDTPKGKLYVTKNSTGQQWAAMTFQDVLIFFQTNQKITYSDWYNYIAKLEIK